MRRENYLAQLRREVRTLALWRDVFAEFVGTFFLVSVQCSLPLLWNHPSGFFGSVVEIGVGMGMIVTTMAETVGHFSGGHFNPAVTFAMAISFKVTFLRAILYIAIQCAGGIAGAAFIYAMTPSGSRDGLAATLVNDDIEPWKGMLIEAWITTILVLTIFGATNAKRKAVFMPTIPIGFAIALGIMSGIAYTGGSMNPARSLGPAVMMGLWDNHWVYWAGPGIGAVLASFVYWVCFNMVDRPRSDDPDKLG